MSVKPTVYGLELSPPVRAVLLTLKALDVDYDFQVVNTLAGEQNNPEYLKKNPQHTIPLLEDDGKFIADSHAIIAYLARKYGKDDSLYPEDFYQRAVVDQRLHYENGVIFMTCIRGAIGPIFRGTVTKDEIPEKLKPVQDVYAMLETFLNDQPFMAGSGLTIADLSIISTVSSFQAIAPIDGKKYPKLAAWYARMTQLPYYEEANGKGVNEINAMMKSKLA